MDEAQETPLKNVQEIREILKQCRDLLAAKFGVKRIGIFGSYVRHEQGKESDIDILVEFKEGCKTFDNYMDLKEFLEKLLGLKVDLVIKSAIKPALKEVILKEVVYV